MINSGELNLVTKISNVSRDIMEYKHTGLGLACFEAPIACHVSSFHSEGQVWKSHT